MGEPRQRRHGILRGVLIWLSLALLALASSATAEPAPSRDDGLIFNDAPLAEPLAYPDWFKRSFLDLQEDMADAIKDGKKGIVVYFGQQRCPYCKMLMEVNFGLPDIVSYTRRHFDFIPIDIWGIGEVTDLNGKAISERDFAIREQANFTPSLIFYDPEGRMALMLRGYYPPYKFRAALEYVADGHYRQESFATYLERGEASLSFGSKDLNDEDFFLPPPHDFNRSLVPGERPLAIFFEHGECHACDILHAQPLRDSAIAQRLQGFDTAQMDIWSDTPVITPDGRKTTAKAWARSLGLFYAPALLFFDERGKEILRIDSVVRLFRLGHILDYIASRAYLEEPNYLRWRMNSGLRP